MEVFLSQLLKRQLLFDVTVDRPIGYKDKYNNIYPINYGFISGIIAGDGEYQDAYILTKKNEKLNAGDNFRGRLIAIIERRDDVETKWIISDTFDWTASEIKIQTMFLEQYFNSQIYLL